MFGKNQITNNEIPDRVVIYKGELDYISRCILDYPDIETGGNLFGFYTTFHIPVIQYVLGPGVNSQRTTTRFRQDEAFFNTNADMLIKEHALHHIGTWHSHHKLGIDHPSGGDAGSMFYGMKADGLETFLLVIGNCNERETTVNAYYFSLSNKKYQPCQFVVLNENSPIRIQYDQKHRDIINTPHTSTPYMRQMPDVPLYGDTVTKKVSFTRGYWLDDGTNREEWKTIVGYMKRNYKNVSLHQQEEDNTIKITIQDNVNYDIIFPQKFPKIPPEIYCNSKIYPNDGWEKKGNISEMVINYFERKKQYDR
jgi:hypothetical protein